MNITRYVWATVVSLVVLLLLNMFVFPLICSNGVASKFANARPAPLVALHLAAFLATAALLTALCAVPRVAESSLTAAGLGAVAGLLAALPSSFHTVAMAELSSVELCDAKNFDCSRQRILGFVSRYRREQACLTLKSISTINIIQNHTVLSKFKTQTVVHDDR